jgi:hypothetical protein
LHKYAHKYIYATILGATGQSGNFSSTVREMEVGIAEVGHFILFTGWQKVLYRTSTVCA